MGNALDSNLPNCCLYRPQNLSGSGVFGLQSRAKIQPLFANSKPCVLPGGDHNATALFLSDVLPNLQLACASRAQVLNLDHRRCGGGTLVIRSHENRHLMAFPRLSAEHALFYVFYTTDSRHDRDKELQSVVLSASCQDHEVEL